MKRQVLFIHGGEAYSKYDDFLTALKTQPIRNPTGDRVNLWWCDKLRNKLGDQFEVFTPSMPNKENAQYKEWKIWFERYFKFLHNDVILIGWSQGGYFLAKYLTENVISVSIKALYLVAVPFEQEDFGGEDGGDFSFNTEKLPKLSKDVENIYIFHSKDDFVVPYEHALKYKKMLPEAKLVTFEDKNHFLQEDFPELIKSLKDLG